MISRTNGCPDIAGRYYSSYSLIEIIRQMNDDGEVMATPNIIELSQDSGRALKIDGYQDSDFLFRKEVKYICESRFVSITLEAELWPSIFIVYGARESVRFAKTRSHQLVAELSSEAAALIGIMPVFAGESQWFKFQPVESEAVVDAETMFVLGRESPVSSRRQFIWLCRAAHNDHDVARFLLASRFYDNAELATPSARKHAFLWYELSIKSGDKDASDRLNKLKNAMTPTEINEAKSLLLEWRAEPDTCADEADKLQLS